MAQNFLPGTWRECLDCREQYRPPVSLFVSIAAVFFGSFMLVTGGMSAAFNGVNPLTLIFAPVGGAFTLWGIWQLVWWAKTPVGPLKAFAVEPVEPVNLR